MWMAYSETDARFPDLGTRRRPDRRPALLLRRGPARRRRSSRAFYDGQWFIGEWNNDWIKTATLNDEGLATGVSCFAICSGYISPMDIEFGPNGSLYVVEWGQGFAENNADSGVYRIDYVAGRAPADRPRRRVTPDSGPLPLDRVVLLGRLARPGRHARSPTRGTSTSDGTTDSTEANPTHTYTTAGTYAAKLTVTDESGATGTDTVTIIAGNTRPVVTIEIPENGQVADFGDKIPYKISVTDAEDGSHRQRDPLRRRAGRVQARP